MKQWLIRKLIAFMGNAYVWLDKRQTHELGPILGLEIDDDFESMFKFNNPKAKSTCGCGTSFSVESNIL